MKKQLLLAGGLAIILGIPVVRFGQAYRQWKRGQLERLSSESCLLDTKRGKVEYQLEGDGPVVLLLHGSPGGYDHGMALARFLALDNFTVLAVSRPGFRRTPLSSGESPEEQAALFAATLDALQISRVSVIALSGGGPSGLQFALRYPERCEKLVMLSAVSQKYSEEAVYQSLPPVKRRLKMLFERITVADPILYTISSLIRLSPQDAAAASMISTLVMNNTDTDGYRNDMRQFALMEEAAPKGIELPTLIVHGTADTDVPFKQAKALAATLTDVRLLAIEGGQHFSTLNGEETRLAIRSFLGAEMER